MLGTPEENVSERIRAEGGVGDVSPTKEVVPSSIVPTSSAPEGTEVTCKIEASPTSELVLVNNTGDHKPQESMEIKCSSCEYSFADADALAAHSCEKESTISSSVEPVVDGKIKGNPENIRSNPIPKSSRATRVHQCPHCDKILSRDEHVKRHMNTVHFNLRPFECIVCPTGTKSFGRKDEYERHLRMHERKGDMPFGWVNSPTASSMPNSSKSESRRKLKRKRDESQRGESPSEGSTVDSCDEDGNRNFADVLAKSSSPSVNTSVEDVSVQNVTRTMYNPKAPFNPQAGFLQPHRGPQRHTSHNATAQTGHPNLTPGPPRRFMQPQQVGLNTPASSINSPVVAAAKTHPQSYFKCLVCSNVFRDRRDVIEHTCQKLDQPSTEEAFSKNPVGHSSHKIRQPMRQPPTRQLQLNGPPAVLASHTMALPRTAHPMLPPRHHARPPRLQNLEETSGKVAASSAGHESVAPENLALLLLSVSSDVRNTTSPRTQQTPCSSTFQAVNETRISPSSPHREHLEVQNDESKEDENMAQNPACETSVIVVEDVPPPVNGRNDDLPQRDSSSPQRLPSNSQPMQSIVVVERASLNPNTLTSSPVSTMSALHPSSTTPMTPLRARWKDTPSQVLHPQQTINQSKIRTPQEQPRVPSNDRAHSSFPPDQTPTEYTEDVQSCFDDEVLDGGPIQLSPNVVVNYMPRSPTDPQPLYAKTVEQHHHSQAPRQQVRVVHHSQTQHGPRPHLFRQVPTRMYRQSEYQTGPRHFDSIFQEDRRHIAFHRQQQQQDSAILQTQQRPVHMTHQVQNHAILMTDGRPKRFAPYRPQQAQYPDEIYTNDLAYSDGVRVPIHRQVVVHRGVPQYHEEGVFIDAESLVDPQDQTGFVQGGPARSIAVQKPAFVMMHRDSHSVQSAAPVVYHQRQHIQYQQQQAPQLMQMQQQQIDSQKLGYSQSHFGTVHYQGSHPEGYEYGSYSQQTQSTGVRLARAGLPPQPQVQYVDEYYYEMDQQQPQYHEETFPQLVARGQLVSQAHSGLDNRPPLLSSQMQEQLGKPRMVEKRVEVSPRLMPRLKKQKLKEEQQHQQKQQITGGFSG